MPPMTEILLWSFLLLCTGLEQNLLVIQPERRTALRGQAVILSCQFECCTDESIIVRPSWHKDGISGQEIFDNDPRYSGRITMPSTSELHHQRNASFIITNLTLEDSGTYFCFIKVVRRIQGSTILSGVGPGETLIVKSQPTRPSLMAEILDSDEDSLIQLQCMSHGFFPASLNATWIISGQEKYENEISCNFARNEDGTYTVISMLNITTLTANSSTDIHLGCEIQHETLEASLKSKLVKLSLHTGPHTKNTRYATDWVRIGLFIAFTAGVSYMHCVTWKQLQKYVEIK
ncbi:tyrosine-protein phosphatase non-receptor type substrate 1-like isoform X2 [Protopterus annectens]|uniref:tyrosine-protein phosphatase non-receptor type substrate 1-like isoform X2 n=1 Tax=Protopterus annectens TaxID=7888 RepID=UPI001CFB7F58|nr:tyrosine-protein phosphatase non-receptor type substrate 1-like isoform X2 [Protopterus annectens]